MYLHEMKKQPISVLINDLLTNLSNLAKNTLGGFVTFGDNYCLDVVIFVSVLCRCRYSNLCRDYQ